MCALKHATAFLVSALDMPALSPSPSCPSFGSLYNNNIGDEGASALAAILKETNITVLKCAAAPSVRCVSAR